MEAHSVGSAARAAGFFLAVAQCEALQLVARRVVTHAVLAAVTSRVTRAAAPQLLLAALALASATAGERAHLAARPRRRAALAVSVRARAGVVLLRSWLQLPD